MSDLASSGTTSRKAPNKTFVFINVRKKKYARYEGKDQKEIFFADKLIEDPYWIEMLRTSPADAIAPDEAELDAHYAGL